MTAKLYKGTEAVVNALSRLRCNAWRSVGPKEPLSSEPCREDALLVEAELIKLQELLKGALDRAASAEGNVVDVSRRANELQELWDAQCAESARLREDNAKLAGAQEAYNAQARSDREMIGARDLRLITVGQLVEAARDVLAVRGKDMERNPLPAYMERPFSVLADLLKKYDKETAAARVRTTI